VRFRVAHRIGNALAIFRIEDVDQFVAGGAQAIDGEGARQEVDQIVIAPQRVLEPGVAVGDQTKAGPAASYAPFVGALPPPHLIVIEKIHEEIGDEPLRSVRRGVHVGQVHHGLVNLEARRQRSRWIDDLSEIGLHVLGQCLRIVQLLQQLGIGDSVGHAAFSNRTPAG